MTNMSRRLPMLSALAMLLASTGCSTQDARGEHQGRSEATAPGRLSAIGEMTTQRAAHTATLLADGRVLIAGGFLADGASLSSTELFNSATGRFTPAPSMGAARVSHTATRLADGRVLIAGGFSGDYLGSAEIYDPATNRFVPVGSMTMARSGHTATLLNNGKVLIAGGTGTGWTFLPHAELFDPRTGRFHATGGMRTARESHTATLLRDGRVFVAGGHAGRRPAVVVHASAEIYDPVSGAFAPAGTMTRVRHKHEAILLGDGRVLIAGGADRRDGRGAYVSAEIYDPATRRYIVTGYMNIARYKLQGTSVLLKGGKVLVAGGADRAEIFDPTAGTFSIVPGSFGTSRLFATATLLPDGHVLIAGGYDDANAASSRAWTYKTSA